MNQEGGLVAGGDQSSEDEVVEEDKNKKVSMESHFVLTSPL
jgi:hypothetical protein